MIGIYKIENKLNGHKYIGQSINIIRRWDTEKRVAFQEAAHEYDYPLSKAFRKYGIENFSFEVLEECSISELNDRERYWINFYNTFYDGYNQTLGGDSPKNKLKEDIIGVIYDLENTDMYHKDIAAKWNLSQEMVQGINTGRYWFQENKEYPLQKKHQSHSRHFDLTRQCFIENLNTCIDCGKTISRQAIRCMECNKVLGRKVERPSADELYQYLLSINGNFSEASRQFGVSDNAIRKWCKNYNIPSSSKEYKNINTTLQID